MNRIPQHNSSQYLDFGVTLLIVTPGRLCHTPVAYNHQDDYYIFGVVRSGNCCGMVDFEELRLTAGDAFIVQPGQVHRFVEADRCECVLLMADARLVGDKEKSVFDNFALHASTFNMDERLTTELWQIATLLDARLANSPRLPSSAVVSHLAKAFIAIMAEAVQNADRRRERHKGRAIEIMLVFRRLLTEELPSSRQPSHYASRLNISTVYLNEVVKKVTGLSTASYIKGEIIVRAKRLLAGTDLPIKQIADRLGFDDCAYFTRLFTSTTGASPTVFRQKFLE